MSDLTNIKAVIFDMDGLLLDSERIALATFVAACRENDFEPDVAVYYRCIGGNDSRTREVLTEGYGEGFHYDTVMASWQKKNEEEASTRAFPVKPGALYLLQGLKARKIKMAVVTSTRRDSAVRKLSNAGMLPFFEFVIGGDQIKNSKPHPEIYLTACRRLGEKPSDCLALEDSDNGVLSATAAGLTVIQVPDLLSPSEKVKALGHRIVSSLVEVEELLREAKR